MPSSSGTGIGDEVKPVVPSTDVGHGMGTGAEEVPVVPRSEGEVALELVKQF